MSGPTGPRYEFVNNDQTRIGVQGGNLYGDVNYHNHYNRVVHGDDIPIVPPDATPQQRFEAGKEHLSRGMRSTAYRLIWDAIADGWATTESFYYGILSILSKRPLQQFDGEDVARVRSAIERSRAESNDGWTVASAFIWSVLNAYLGMGSGNATEEEARSLPQRLLHLDAERQSEIRMHLGSMLNRVVRYGVDATEAAEVGRRRHAGDRTRRAVKFFIPEPIAPLRRQPRPPVAILRHLGLAVCLLLVAIGVGRAGGLLVHDRGATGLALACLLVAGGAALVTAATRWLWLRERRLQKAYERSIYNTRQIDETGSPEAVAARLALWNAFYSAADAWFASQLREGESDEQWERVRVGPQVALANDLACRYGEASERPPFLRAVLSWIWSGVRCAVRRFRRRGVQTPPPTRYERFVERQRSVPTMQDVIFYRYEATVSSQSADLQKLGWLIETHAADTAARWRDGTLSDGGRRQWPQVPLVFLLIAGASALAGAALLTLPGLLALHPVDTAEAVLLVGAGTWLGSLVGYRAAAGWMHHAADRAEFADQFHSESRAHANRVAYLRDRPEDAEMADWLDWDQRALRLAAFDVAGLESWEVVWYFFLLEADPDCMRARQVNGPPRYSKYRVHLFMLTETEVRYFRWKLDFLQGQEDPQTFRRTFGYDKIVSASVEQVGVTLERGRRRIVELTDYDSLAGRPRTDQFIVSQALRLSLKDQDKIEMLAENYDRFLHANIESLSQLVRLASETSGMTVGVLILEAATGAGRAWFERQLERRRTEFAGRLRDSLPARPRALPPDPDGAAAS
jgi:hypothetical protein